MPPNPATRHILATSPQYQTKRKLTRRVDLVNYNLAVLSGFWQGNTRR